MESIVGAIFPVSLIQAKRILEEDKRVFGKYTKFNRLKENDKLIFYVSGEKKLAGEAVIEKITCLTPTAAWMTYGAKLFLNKKEFEQYTSISPIGGKTRTSPKITLFLLKDVKKYDPAIQSSIKMTPSGCYFNSQEYQRIIK